jgi:hypothetical protein
MPQMARVLSVPELWTELRSRDPMDRAVCGAQGGSATRELMTIFSVMR